MGQSGSPLVIQAHLKKLFAGIHSVAFDDDSKPGRIVAMRSALEESVTLGVPVPISGAVEVGGKGREWRMLDCVRFGPKTAI